MSELYINNSVESFILKLLTCQTRDIRQSSSGVHVCNCRIGRDILALCQMLARVLPTTQHNHPEMMHLRHSQHIGLIPPHTDENE